MGGASGPLVLGHRGASARKLENTLSAFAACEGIADGFELDVRLCETGEVVVFHDDTLDRMAGRPSLVRELSWRELSAVDLGDGQRIPTLCDVSTELPWALVNVEIKKPPPQLARRWVTAVLDVVRETRSESRVLISS